MNRDLDGIYFRIKRGEKWDNICFSDLTDEEMDAVLEGRDAEWLKSVCKILGRTIKFLGDTFDICCGDEEKTK